jgi:predicted membrane channel-forming protein YqfA (hemolysin III family)
VISWRSTLPTLDSRWRDAHAVWHGFVMTGSGFHFFAVLHNVA